MDVLKTIAKWNKKQIPDNTRLKEIDENRNNNKSVGPLDIFRPRRMLLKSLALGFAW